MIALLFLLLQRVPAHYPSVAHPIPPPDAHHRLGGGLAGFASPYLGHTGSWDGKGGAGLGSKIADLETERAMGLHWTFMPVYWSKLEPKGPVDPDRELPAAWRELDDFVIAAHDRGLNVLMQAPVVGGNAGGPPRWAGRRVPGHSAPENMDALADFAGKLAQRYAPGGALARRSGWGSTYGVRAWELDNEPADYFTNWWGEAGDYAEFVTRAAAKIRAADRQAVIVAPALASGADGRKWLEEALDAREERGSSSYRRSGSRYSLGPATDAVSFHVYEGLDTAFSGKDRTIETVFSEVRDIFERWERRSPGFEYRRKQEYWHTEGSYDFIGALSAKRRAAWRFQFMTRAFAAGIRKIVVMDPSREEQAAVRAYVRALPDPFPMLRDKTGVKVLHGNVVAYRHPTRGGTVWALWATAGTGNARVEVPVRSAHVEVVTVTGEPASLPDQHGRLTIDLTGDTKMAPPVLVIDRK